MVAVAVLGLAGSGAVAQGVSFSGSAGMGVVYEGSTKMMDPGDTTKEVTKMESSITWDSDFDIAISASGTTDGGLTFGAATAIEAGQGGGEVVDSEVYVGGESWTVKIGSLDPASHKGRVIGDVGYNGLGVDDVAEAIHDEQGTMSQVEVSFSLGAASLAITAGQKDGLPYGKDADGAARHVMNDDGGKVLAPATKEDTEWAAGIDFGIGSTSLGIGYDSEKLIQAGISADLGSFGGKLFFSQQNMSDEITDDKGDAFRTMLTGSEGIFSDTTGHVANAKDDTKLDRKYTGIGLEISVSAGPNTTINAVYAQGKNSDTRSSVGYDVSNGELNESEDGYVDSDGSDISDYTTIELGADSATSKTDKAFGIGVSHNLGGGATLQAGFAKVKKQTKASVGVTMSF